MCYSIEFEKELDKISKEFAIPFLSKSKDELFKKVNELKGDEFKRVYKNHYAPAFIWKNNQSYIVPLRFNLLPHFSKTKRYEFFDSKLNKTKEIKTYNARVENLTKTKAYSHLIGRLHCVIPIKTFFEWGKVNGEKKEIKFSYEGKTMLLAGLWDHWSDNKGDFINSFSIITTSAREEVGALGHHRSPVIINPENLNNWLAAKENFWQILENTNSKKLSATILEK